MAGLGGSVRTNYARDEGHLQLGTTKASTHVPGYCGHIPTNTNPNAAVAPRDPNAKTLVIENYKPYQGWVLRGYACYIKQRLHNHSSGHICGALYAELKWKVYRAVMGIPCC